MPQAIDAVNGSAAAIAGSSRPKQIAGLDVLRFLCAIYVVFHHLGWRLSDQNPDLPMTYHYFARYARPGFIAVEIFFVLSGFVIAYSAAHASARKFALSRAVRLYPAAWVCSTATVLILTAIGAANLLTPNMITALGGGDVFAVGALWTPKMVRGWFDCLVLWPLGPFVEGSYWSLGVEIGFYAQLCVLLYFHRFRWIGAWMSTVGVASVLSMAWMVHVGLHGTTSRVGAWYADMIANHSVTRVALLRHGSYFAIGVLLWLMLLDRFSWKRLFAAVLMLPGVYLDVRERVAWYGNWWLPFVLWALAVGLIVCSVLWNERIHSVLGARGLRITRRLGLLTYPLYLIHATAGTLLIARLRPYLPDLLNFCLVSCSLIALAYAIQVLFEEPIQNALRLRLLHRRKPLPTVAATAP